MTIVQWKVRAIRGATTVTANTIEAIREAVTELLEAIEYLRKEGCPEGKHPPLPQGLDYC
jgi:hypothetical protein